MCEMNRWLLIDDGPASGAENMARDEHLLARAGAAPGAPVLRLYSFRPPAITIGYHQRPERAIDFAAARADGVDVVRRVTGGRALLHDGELTYCVVSPLSAPRAPISTELYLRISEALAGALRSIGVRAEVSRGAPGRAMGAAAPCLLSTTRWELTARGRKIAGSAQRSMRGAVLQHGSILLTDASARIERYARSPRGRLAGKVTSVSEELGRAVEPGALADAIKRSFAASFGIEWEPFAFSAEEEREVEALAREKERELSALPTRSEPRDAAPAPRGALRAAGREVVT